MAAVKYRVLGNSGVYVSELCLGTMNFGGPTPEADAHRIIDSALDIGINFIDTANQYVDGRSEETVGRGIKANRHKWVLATKVASPLAEGGPNSRGLSRMHIMKCIDDSLRRLGTDHIDLYYQHKLGPETAWEQVVETFGNLIRQGKIREWGLSNVRAWHIPHIHHLCRQAGVPAPTALQPYYNLMNRQPEVDVLPAASFFGLGIVPYSPLARGILSGKYKLNQTPEAGTRAARGDKRFMEAEFRPESIVIAEKLKEHASKQGTTLISWATAWVLNNKAVTAAIAGPRTLEQWTSYLGALDYKWKPEDEALADSLVATGHPSTPGYSDPQYPIEGRFPTIG